MSVPKIDLIRQALSAAESSIKLARQLLSEVEVEGRGKARAKELPGTVGMFDGQNMATEKGENFPVPENYASKSILVVGDTLKLVSDGGEKRFKQIEHVKRHKTTGILTKKDGKWAAVTPEGSYKVLNASVEHFNGNVGDEVLLQIPANNLQTTWAALENISKKGKEETKEAKEKTETVEKTEVKETKLLEEKEKIATGETQKKEEAQKKVKEEKPKQVQEAPKAEAKEEKPRQAQPTPKEETRPEKPEAAAEKAPIPAEVKPAPAEEVKPAAAETKPAPAESEPAQAESKPTTEEVAEDELR